MGELRLGPLGFGGANLGNLFAPMTDDGAAELLQAAWDAGIRYFDTAPHYGLGLSERRLGRFLAGKPRAEYVVSTKAGRLLRPSPGTAGERDADLYDVPADVERVWDFTADGVRRSLAESLERLGLDRVDVLFLHDPEGAGLEGALATGVPAVVALREEGLVDAVGVGSTSTGALVAAARTGALDLLMVAGRYTLLEQPAAAELLPECRERGIGVVAAGVLNSGLLASPRPGEGARYEYLEAPAGVLARARRLADVCDGFGVELPAAALQFPRREPSVRSVVLGAGSAAELRETVDRAHAPVPDALWEALAAQGMVPA
ncbi:aldo/keto reductase [Pseudonocardia humida]|uniref:Aldo/keto reductase n=1 Tax=Pseudonocardia humida TaxID=2800819 RepID=A0ABT1A485_9PSEU|nr:aldo/keto reductase [Pseudonocardia humida]MCO1657756.1 aldo/keto reductase [Pseudonocardia humida]